VTSGTSPRELVEAKHHSAESSVSPVLQGAPASPLEAEVVRRTPGVRFRVIPSAIGPAIAIAIGFLVDKEHSELRVWQGAARQWS